MKTMGKNVTITLNNEQMQILDQKRGERGVLEDEEEECEEG